MPSVPNNMTIIALTLAVLSLSRSVANCVPVCAQRFANTEDFVCRNVRHNADVQSLGRSEWRHLKIVNEAVELLDWSETPKALNNLESLDVSQVGKLILHQNVFDGLPNLVSLNVSGCKMYSLAAAIKLKNLDASWNSLENLNSRDFPFLEVANLSHNEIQKIDHDNVFTKLKVLHLDFNQLQSLALNGYSSLKVLTVSDNSIEQLFASSFKALSAMEQFIITSGPLNYIEDHTFESMMELKILNVSGNSLERMSPHIFAGLSRLTHLDVNSNNINELAELQFQHLAKLQFLDISRNSLKSLNSSHFHNLAGLRKLFVYENDIEEVKAGTFANLLSLDTLDLSSNNIEHFDKEVFGSQTLPRLRKLILKSNSLKDLHPLVFASLPFLQYLSLGFNQLSRLDVRMFAPLRRLEKLHLGNNLIETISSDVLESLDSVKELLLDKNRLSFLSDSNATFSKLEKVSLEGNPWQCPCWLEMSEYLEERRISYVRDQSPYFRGQKPLCVVTPVDFCVKDLRLVKEHKIEEIYNSG